MSNKIINFASENYAGTQMDMMRALNDANSGHVPSYGNDRYTDEATIALKENFGAHIGVYFTFNGTGANNFGLACAADRYNSIFCSDVAHLYVDESTAPESFTGCRIYPVKSRSGKIAPQELQLAIKRAGDIHHPQPKVVSITQPTEYGTVYTPGELRELKGICEQNNMLLHADGARFFNAAASLGLSLTQMSQHLDILTLGGTKAGMMFGEAVIFFGESPDRRNRFNLKRSMQLASKNRFIAAQFTAMLKGELWRVLAQYTNNLAKRFEQQISAVPEVTIAHPVQTNAVFLNMPRALHFKMQQHSNFYYWNEQKNEARLVFSFDNTEEEITRFIKLLQKYAAG